MSRMPWLPKKKPIEWGSKPQKLDNSQKPPFKPHKTGDGFTCCPELGSKIERTECRERLIPLDSKCCPRCGQKFITDT